MILDEAHSIAEKESGTVWEHLLSLTMCPFLALSATLANIENFADWLRSLRKEPVKVITHSERANYQRMLTFDMTETMEKKRNQTPLSQPTTATKTAATTIVTAVLSKEAPNNHSQNVKSKVMKKKQKKLKDLTKPSAGVNTPALTENSPKGEAQSVTHPSSSPSSASDTMQHLVYNKKEEMKKKKTLKPPVNNNQISSASLKSPTSGTPMSPSNDASSSCTTRNIGKASTTTAMSSFRDICSVSLNTHQTLKLGISLEWKLLPDHLLQLYTSLQTSFSPLSAVSGFYKNLLSVMDYRERYAFLSALCIIKANEELPRNNDDLLTLLFQDTKETFSLDQLKSLRGQLANVDVGPSFSLSSLLALLQPELFFGGEVFKNEVSLYDILLRRFCVTAARDNRLFAAFATLNPPTSHVRSIYLSPQIPRVIGALHREDMLPAIVFSFDRDLCDSFCQAATREYPFSLDPCSQTHTLVEEAVIDLLKAATYPIGWQMECLRAGYAVHHAGCSDEYKMEVERLFRAKALRVIFATGTLAMGIHMPCRTVVLAGASPYLTPVSMRQIAGRAGRRGFDSIGNVVFLGIGIPVIKSLMFAHLPKVQGSLPITCTTCYGC